MHHPYVICLTVHINKSKMFVLMCVKVLLCPCAQWSKRNLTGGLPVALVTGRQWAGLSD